MSSDSYHYVVLFNRLLKGRLSPQDTDALISWLGSDDLDPQAAELILQQLQKPVAEIELSDEIKNSLEARLTTILADEKKIPSGKIHLLKRNWFRYAAASIILFAIVSAWFFYSKDKPQQKLASTNPAPAKIDIAPGKKGAVLTLSTGRTILLDSIGNGVIATDDGAQISYNNGQITYNADGTQQVAYNTMTTQRGRQFQLVLPDGTKVWLNAESSVKYPTAFIGKERKVEISGEAYFEVAKNEKLPFHVKINDETEVVVLGTHFNINSYNNESSVNTTLLEGSVQVYSKGERIILKPGQQAQVINTVADASGQNQKLKIVSDVNLRKVMAWKDGVFDFDDATLKEVMRQLERWYNIDVVYEKGVPELEFMGSMGRDLSLSEVLNGLKLSEVHFRIEEGRKLIVMP